MAELVLPAGSPTQCRRVAEALAAFLERNLSAFSQEICTCLHSMKFSLRTAIKKL